MGPDSRGRRPRRPARRGGGRSRPTTRRSHRPHGRWLLSRDCCSLRASQRVARCSSASDRPRDGGAAPSRSRSRPPSGRRPRPNDHRRSKPVKGSVFADASLAGLEFVVGVVSLGVDVVGVPSSFDGEVPVLGVPVVGRASPAWSAWSGVVGWSGLAVTRGFFRRDCRAGREQSEREQQHDREGNQRAYRAGSSVHGRCACCPWPARGHDVGPSHANLRFGGVMGFSALSEGLL